MEPDILTDELRLEDVALEELAEGEDRATTYPTDAYSGQNWATATPTDIRKPRNERRKG